LVRNEIGFFIRVYDIEVTPKSRPESGRQEYDIRDQKEDLKKQQARFLITLAGDRPQRAYGFLKSCQ
jgi:hypothetical protein